MRTQLAASITTALGAGIGDGSRFSVLSKRPYCNARGESFVDVFTGRTNDKGEPIMAAQRIHQNATLRKDEWLVIDQAVIESFRERLVIVEDLRAAGLTQGIGGIGTTIAEWENASEITDAEVTMDGESQTDEDRQEFGINGVPVPVISKRFKIGERTLLASRTRGASLDVTTSVEAARAVARTSEKMVFNGGYLGAVKSAANTYQIYGLTNFPNREMFSISDWSDDTNVSPEEILAEILQMVQLMETEQRRYGPFNIYIPAEYSFRFREDFKEFGDRTLLQRVLAEPAIKDVKVADVLEDGNVVMVQLDREVIDMAVGSDLSTIQWASPSGWTNFFQSFAVWAPRLKTDYDGRTGILHATVGT